MRYFLDMFSGIGGFALGAKWAGLEFNGHYFSEVDNYAIGIYKKRFPGAIELGDITKIDYAALPKGEWYVSGGFPCQPHSVAGKKRASKDERDLWPECARMLRELRPRIALFENVPGLFVSDRGRFFNGILRDIYERGHDAEWQVISAFDAGAPHLRKRVWIAAYPQSERWGAIQKNKNTTYKKSCGAEYQNWAELQFAVTGTYSIELRKGDESLICGMDDGLPYWLDRLKGLGNAVVPQIPELLWRLIKAALWN